MSNSTALRTREAALYQTTKNCYEKAKQALINTLQLKKTLKLLTEGSKEYNIALNIIDSERMKTEHYLREYDKYHQQWVAFCKANQFKLNTTDLDSVISSTDYMQDSQS